VSEAGDDDRVKKLQEEINGLRTDWGKEFREGREEVNQLLTQDQLAKIEARRNEWRESRNNRSVGSAVDPAKKLDGVTVLRPGQFPDIG